jgi:hypothetical protein
MLGRMSPRAAFEHSEIKLIENDAIQSLFLVACLPSNRWEKNAQKQSIERVPALRRK